MRALRAQVRSDGLDVVVPPPPTVARGSMRGVLVALKRDRATCLERSLVVQRWYASSGVALDVIVGVRLPGISNDESVPTAHAWVEFWDADCSDLFTEIRRVSAPEGVPPAATGR